MSFFHSLFGFIAFIYRIRLLFCFYVYFYLFFFVAVYYCMNLIILFLTIIGKVSIMSVISNDFALTHTQTVYEHLYAVTSTKAIKNWLLNTLCCSYLRSEFIKYDIYSNRNASYRRFYIGKITSRWQKMPEAYLIRVTLNISSKPILLLV